MSTESASGTKFFGKDRTKADSIAVGANTADAKGTLVLLSLVQTARQTAKLRSYFVPDISFADAQFLGRRVEGFYWVANSVASFDEVKTAKMSDMAIMTPHDSACSCPPANPGPCWDLENGGCFCDCGGWGPV